jgi:hypothetical protein
VVSGSIPLGVSTCDFHNFIADNMKDNIDFYPHYADSDQNGKFFVLRVKYGWAGEGMFWALNNAIAQAPKCTLKIGDVIRKAPLADKFRMNLEEFDIFISYLINDCRLLVQKGDYITTEMVQETYLKIEAEREKSRNRRTGKKAVSGTKRENSPELSKSSPEPNKRVDKSKVEESKVEEKPVLTVASSPFFSGKEEPQPANQGTAKEKEKISAKKEEQPDLVADTVRWLTNDPQGQREWKGQRDDLECGPNELTDPYPTVLAASKLLGPAKKKDPELFRMSLAGCAKTQLQKDRKSIKSATNVNSTHNRRDKETDAPLISREASVRVASRLYQQEQAEIGLYGF